MNKINDMNGKQINVGDFFLYANQPQIWQVVDFHNSKETSKYVTVIGKDLSINPTYKVDQWLDSRRVTVISKEEAMLRILCN